MNRLTKFFHEMFNPHCAHCHEELEQSRICKSCETLKYQVERLIYENGKLLESVTSPKSNEAQPIDTSNLKPIRMPNAGLSWNARRQILEREDREAARLLNEKKREIASITTEKLEEDLGIKANG